MHFSLLSEIYRQPTKIENFNSLRSRCLEVVGAHYFQAPATQAIKILTDYPQSNWILTDDKQLDAPIQTLF